MDFDQTIVDVNRGMIECARIGSKEGVEFYIQKGANDWNNGMWYAAQGGHRDLVDLFIAKGANEWNEGMLCASENGHRDLVDLFITKGANDWNNGMFNAAINGHQALVEFFNQKLHPVFADYTGTEICGICYDTDAQDLVSTKCNHVFHRECIRLWEQRSCPICRREL